MVGSEKDPLAAHMFQLLYPSEVEWKQLLGDMFAKASEAIAEVRI